MNHTKIIKPSVITLGNFDGFHRGHMALVNAANEHAKKKDLLSMIFTTIPSASEFFGKEKKKILDDKAFFVRKHKLCDLFISYKFDYKTADTKPLDFLSMITRDYNVRAIVVGENYRYGKDAKGDISLLEEFTNEYEIDLIVLKLLYEGEMKISSTNIRKFISEGDIEKANYLLGYNFFKRAFALKADGRGSAIGFPTANLDFEENSLVPSFGVYITKTTVLGNTFNSITNVGPKPTFDVLMPQIETHIIGKQMRDLYGETMEVSFYKKIRDVVKFSSVEELKKQINLDIEIAKDYFAQEKNINANTKI